MKSGYDERKEGGAQYKAGDNAPRSKMARRPDVMASEIKPPTGMKTT